MCCGLVESAAFWRRLSPGKNPPLILEHLGFHPSSLPPLLSSSLPPSFSCLYISLHRACCFGPGDFFFFIPASSAFGGQHTASLSRRRGKHSELSRCLLQLLYTPAVPTHQTPLTHGTDPRGAHACLCKGSQTNLPPQYAPSLTPPPLLYL